MSDCWKQAMASTYLAGPAYAPSRGYARRQRGRRDHRAFTVQLDGLRTVVEALLPVPEPRERPTRCSM